MESMTNTNQSGHPDLEKDTAAIETYGDRDLGISTNVVTLLAVCSLIQLGLRHPEVRGTDCAEISEKWVSTTADGLGQIDPHLKQMLLRGFNWEKDPIAEETHRLISDDAPLGVKINRIFAFIGQDEDGNEGILSMKLSDSDFGKPMLGPDEKTVEALRPHAIAASQLTKKKIILCLFSKRQDLEEIG